MTLPIKDPEEKKVVTFPFKREVPKGLTIALASVSATTLSGTDPTPSAVLDSAPQIDNTNLYVLQRVKAGVDGCSYELRATATDSAGGVHVVVASLPVAVLHSA